MRESIKSVCIVVVLFATVATPFAWLWDRPGLFCWSIRLGGPLLDVIAVWLIYKLERESRVTSAAGSRQASRPTTSDNLTGDRRLTESKQPERFDVPGISDDSANALLRQWEQSAEAAGHPVAMQPVPRNPWSNPRDKAIVAAILIAGVACGVVWCRIGSIATGRNLPTG